MLSLSPISSPTAPISTEDWTPPTMLLSVSPRVAQGQLVKKMKQEHKGGKEKGPLMWMMLSYSEKPKESTKIN